ATGPRRSRRTDRTSRTAPEPADSSQASFYSTRSPGGYQEPVGLSRGATAPPGRPERWGFRGATRLCRGPRTLGVERSDPAVPGGSERWGVWGAISGPPIFLGRVGREPHGLRARLVVGDDVDDGRLARRVGALERRPDLVRLLDELAVRSQLLRELVVARMAEVAPGLGQRARPRRVRRPPAVVADHDHDRDLVTHGRVDVHGVDAERAIAVEHEHLGVGFGDLGAHAVGQADAHGAECPRVEPVAGHVGRDGLAAEVQDLLAVD